MKKAILTLSALVLTSSIANAGVPIFTTNDSGEITVKPTQEQNVFTNYQQPKTTSSTKPYGTIQNDGYKNAISNLENAQAEIRENLVDIKAQYTDAQNRYDIAKTQCKALKKQIRDSERKIKKLEKTKESISKNIIEGI